MKELMAKYAWADADADLAWTVAVVGGAAEGDVVRCYGGDPERPVGAMTFREAAVPEDDFGEYFFLQVMRRGSHVVAVENNGWSGDVPGDSRVADRGGV